MKPFFFILLTLILSTIISCTGNDLFDDEVKLTKTSISGTVKLEDQTDHSGIYVWFPLTDKGIFTDANGNFSYTIPSNYKQTGLGYFQFYFYVNDYILQKDSVSIRDGKFEYGVGNLNGEGAVTSVKTLERIFEISEYSDSTLPVFNDQKYFKWFKINIKKHVALSYPLDTIRIIGKNSYYQISSYYALADNSFEISSLKFSSIKSLIYPDNYLVYLSLEKLKDVNAPIGNYTILPFITVLQEGIPKSLLDNIPYNPNLISEFYLVPNKYNRLSYILAEPF